MNVAGVTPSIETVVFGGNIIEHQSEPQVEPEVSSDIELIYLDQEVLVINKPAPLPMHPSGRFNKNSLIEILKIAFPNEDFKIIHRLDANTTGIVVLAREVSVVASIVEQFENREVKKEYLALVEGVPAENKFSSKEKISIEKTASGSRELKNDGVEAHTEFEVVERRIQNNETLLRVIPLSGRTNQIRLHLVDLGYPIIGDIGYKEPDYFKNNPLTYPTDCLCLHAWKLTFKLKGKVMNFRAPVPSKFGFDEF